ncbi:putative transporter C11D3.18C 8 [Colletotrichum chlorophyti]|uniref:Putative transporter C11D3.18C 8 n=1 Tax=Colletotrichum chlorophyti TaxID=708187 RepID=A0A1Q8RAK3_9PEZI|nr:putative transporter C11D3.18C 8 [Colletotrichum chlorophyti]
MASNFYRQKDGPRYILGHALELGFISVGIIAALILIFSYIMINKKHDTRMAAGEDRLHNQQRHRVPAPDIAVHTQCHRVQFEHMRRYHKYKEGSYHFPNDDPEQERENMKHFLVVYLSEGALHEVPLVNPQRILDVGTGTGAWAIEMGDEYPGAIVGTDLSPIQPDWVPSNVRFLIDDAEENWLEPDGSLDYVHLRNMAPSIKDWPRLFWQASIQSGGWMELQELHFRFGCDDSTMSPDYAPARMVQYVKEGLAQFGVDLTSADQYAQRATAAGFVDIRHSVKKVPVGPWPKEKYLREVGWYCRTVIYDGLHAVTIGPLTRGLGWTSEQVELFLLQVGKELTDSSVHSYIYYHSVVARNPQHYKSTVCDLRLRFRHRNPAN